MNNNVIDSQFVIEYHDGTIEILGYDRGGVVFRVCGSSVSDLVGGQPRFCRNTIFTHDATTRKRVLIFEYSLGQDLRNPRKLLRSVRNRLIQSGFRNRRADDANYNEMYTVPDCMEHNMFLEQERGLGPIPKVCY